MTICDIISEATTGVVLARDGPALLQESEYPHSRRTLHLFITLLSLLLSKPTATMSLSSSAVIATATALLHNGARDLHHVRAEEDAEELNCGTGGGDHSMLGLRVASIFIILVGSTFGALFPVVAKRSSWLHVPKSIFECVSS